MSLRIWPRRFRRHFSYLVQVCVGLRAMNAHVRLTSEERLTLHRWRDQSELPYRKYFGQYAAIFLPMVSFATYGVIKQDWIALLIAFGGLLIYQLWELSYNVSRVTIHRTLLTKLVEREFGETSA